MKCLSRIGFEVVSRNVNSSSEVQVAPADGRGPNAQPPAPAARSSRPPQVGVVPGGPAALTAAVAVARSPGGPGVPGHTAVSPDGHSFTSEEARP